MVAPKAAPETKIWVQIVYLGGDLIKYQQGTGEWDREGDVSVHFALSSQPLLWDQSHQGNPRSPWRRLSAPEMVEMGYLHITSHQSLGRGALRGADSLAHPGYSKGGLSGCQNRSQTQNGGAGMWQQPHVHRRGKSARALSVSLHSNSSVSAGLRCCFLVQINSEGKWSCGIPLIWPTGQ